MLGFLIGVLILVVAYCFKKAAPSPVDACPRWNSAYVSRIVTYGTFAAVLLLLGLLTRFVSGREVADVTVFVDQNTNLYIWSINEARDTTPGGGGQQVSEFRDAVIEYNEELAHLRDGESLDWVFWPFLVTVPPQYTYLAMQNKKPEDAVPDPAP